MFNFFLVNLVFILLVSVALADDSVALEQVVSQPVKKTIKTPKTLENDPEYTEEQEKLNKSTAANNFAVREKERRALILDQQNNIEKQDDKTIELLNEEVNSSGK